MKKLILLLAAVALATSVWAQDTPKKPSFAGFVSNGFWDNWEITLGGGAGTALSNGTNQGSFGDRINFEANFGLTKWFHPVTGMRLQLQGGRFANFDDVLGKAKWPYLFVHADFMLNFSNWAGGYREDRAYYAVPFAGFGYMASNFTDKSHENNGSGTHQSFAFTLGWLNKFRISPSFDFNIELKGLIAPSRVSPVAMDGSYLFGFSATAGFTYRFNKRGWQRELLKDVALRVEDSATNDSFRVMGRGEMHLSILIETMRREGYELQVSPPHVLTHEENGKTMEPMERVVIDVPETYQGNVMTALGARKAILMNMQMMNNRSRLEFRMPSRGLFGYRSQFLTDTHGEGIMNTIFDGYEEWCGPIATRSSGSLISFDTGDAVTYGLFNAQQRGTLIVTAGEKVYEGEVVGYTPTGEDITVNVCKTKHLTNTRASGSDDALRLIPVTKFSLEGCLEFLAPDELLEVTPENLRIRKRILDHDLRMKATSKKSKG